MIILVVYIIYLLSLHYFLQFIYPQLLGTPSEFIRMDKSLFKIPKMDCPAEENLVRMKLEGVDAVKALKFNTPKRKVTVYHEGNLATIEIALKQLNLGSSSLETTQTDEALPEQLTQHNLLWTVLLINLTFFVIEVTTGFFSGSIGLVADSLDMLADALVYGLSLLAVGSTVRRKKAIAKWSGYFQLTLAVLGLIEVIRRFIGLESLPDFRVMIIVSIFALIANSASLYLLQRSKSQEAHMKASVIFTNNDIIINLGVILAGVLVNWLGSSVPDLIIGAIVFLIVTQGAFRILRLAKIE